MAAIFPTNNQMTAKMTSLVGMFIWKEHPLRVAFQQLVLPIDKGGINNSKIPENFYLPPKSS
jgi:hypothetical protein